MVQEEADTIAAAAGLVGLPPDDIRSVLLPVPTLQLAAAAQGMEAAAGEAWAALRQVEAQLQAGSAGWQSQQACSAVLGAVAQLQEASARCVGCA